MKTIHMPQEWTNLLEHLYMNNAVVVNFNGSSSELVAVWRGLKQGCPVSTPVDVIHIRNGAAAHRVGYRLQAHISMGWSSGVVNTAGTGIYG